MSYARFRTRVLGGIGAALLLAPPLWASSLWASSLWASSPDSAEKLSVQTNGEGTPAGPVLAGAETSTSDVLPAQIVTATRVVRRGYESPTPTTVIGNDMLELQAPATLADALALQPAMRNTQDEGTGSLIFGGGVGRGFVNMRGLGPDRTLVLLDGQRLDANTVSGQPDISLLPSTLVSRIDLVTGGASAAYGSDAIAGVTNVVLDSRFSGFKANVEGGGSSRSDAFGHKISLTWGGDFGSSLHLVSSVEYFQKDGLGPGTRDYATPPAVVPNPNYSPTNGQKPLEVVDNAYDANESYGGLILNGPLSGQSFLANGSTANYAPPSCALSQPYLVCNSKQNLASPFNFVSLTAPEQRINVFDRLSIDISPDVRARFDVLYASHASSITSGPFASQIFDTFLPISVTQNAYLPENTRNLALAAGQTTLLLGRINQDEGNFEDVNREHVARISAAFDAALGHAWSLSSYVAYSNSRSDDRWLNDFSIARFLNAVDSVIVQGVPVCRVNATALTDPACAPANVFGPGNLSAATRAYFTGTDDNPLTTTQLATALNIAGQPFSTWAGPASLAVGAEGRRDTVDQRNGDPAGVFVFNGVPAFSGSTTVKEVYTELVTALAKGAPVAQSLDTDAAVRLTDYNQSGATMTWKFGINYEPIQDLRLRATRSRDIRAPSLGELDTPSYLSSFTTLTNPPPNGVPLFNEHGTPPGGTVSLREIDGGNPSLVPEVATTTAVGVVLQPRSLNGFTASVDHYAIRIGNAITSLSVGTIVQNCAGGTRSDCSLISYPATSTLPLVMADLVNAQSIYTSGLDVEVAYESCFAGGNLSLRVLANYIDQFNVNLAGTPEQQLAGDIGSGFPNLQASAIASYRRMGSIFAIDGTYIGGGDYSKAQDALIQNNRVPHVWYIGSSVQRTFGGENLNWVVYGRVNNLLDQKPPSPGLEIFSSLNNGIYTGVPYDRIGRYFTLGVRVHTR